jgi:hypothetical protein
LAYVGKKFKKIISIFDFFTIQAKDKGRTGARTGAAPYFFYVGASPT